MWRIFTVNIYIVDKWNHDQIWQIEWFLLRARIPIIDSQNIKISYQPVIFYANFQLAMNSTIDYAHQSFTKLAGIFQICLVSRFRRNQATKRGYHAMQSSNASQGGGEGVCCNSSFCLGHLLLFLAVLINMSFPKCKQDLKKIMTANFKAFSGQIFMQFP